MADPIDVAAATLRRIHDDLDAMRAQIKRDLERLADLERRVTVLEQRIGPLKNPAHK